MNIVFEVESPVTPLTGELFPCLFSGPWQHPRWLSSLLPVLQKDSLIPAEMEVTKDKLSFEKIEEKGKHQNTFPTLPHAAAISLG